MKRIHYGCAVCLVGALILLCNSGMPANVLPIYLPFLEEIGYSGTQTSMLITIRCFAGVVAMLGVTRYYEIFSLKTGLMMSCALVGGAYILMGTARNYITYVLGAAMLGVSYSLGGIVPVSMLMNRWFARRKATAIAICAAGTGLSAMMMPPLIAGVTKSLSLNYAFFATGLLALAVVFVVFLVVRNDPAQIGAQPYGADEEGEEAKKERVYAHRYNLPWKIQMLFFGGMVLFGGATMACNSHYAALFTTEGYAKEIVAMCCSLQGGILIGSKFSYGLFVDKIGGRRTSILFLGILILGSLCCAFSPYGAVFMYLGAVLSAIGMPPTTVGISVWAVEFSTDETYAKVMRNAQMCYTMGGLFMSTLPGYIYDMSGSYSWAYILCSGIMIMFTLLVMSIYRYIRRQLNLTAG